MGVTKRPRASWTLPVALLATARLAASRRRSPAFGTVGVSDFFSFTVAGPRLSVSLIRTRVAERKLGCRWSKIAKRNQCHASIAGFYTCPRGMSRPVPPVPQLILRRYQGRFCSIAGYHAYRKPAQTGCCTNTAEVRRDAPPPPSPSGYEERPWPSRQGRGVEAFPGEQQRGCACRQVAEQVGNRDAHKAILSVKVMMVIGFILTDNNIKLVEPMGAWLMRQQGAQE